MDGDSPSHPHENGYNGSYAAFSADTPTYSAAAAYTNGSGNSEEVAVDHVSTSGPFSSNAEPLVTSGSVSISNGNGRLHYREDSEDIFSSNGPLLPPPNGMQEHGFALREWRRQIAIRLREKERREKEMRDQIIKEAEVYKQSFHEKRNLNVETNKTSNREKEKLFIINREKAHKEAYEKYWKAIAELIPDEVPNIERRGRNKDQGKKASITVVQGPKPGKPTELSRMRRILMKLKNNPPPHLLPLAVTKDLKDGQNTKNAEDGSHDSKEAADLPDDDSLANQQPDR